jgi:Glycerophosphoryl diester phosphodiesterase family
MRLNQTATPNLRLLIFLMLAAIYTNCSAQSTPLLNGFAHNDYRHKHPLFDALDNGFTNIEADIFLQDTTLVVAHICPLFREGKTLEKLYLKPLYDRVMQNNGRVYSNYARPVILMIDVKTKSDNTYRELERMLDKYRTILTSYNNGTVIYRAVTVVISGHKPYRLLEGEHNRLAFIDDDLRKVAHDTVTHDVFSMASCKYSRLLSWDGKGVIPSFQKQQLCNFVAMAHSMGAKVRLWASPERKAVWDELLKCGVDLINTDKLVTLKNYLNANTVTLAKLN